MSERLTYTVKELARAVGMSETYIREQIRAGVLPRIGGTGRKVLIPKTAVDEWMKTTA